MSDESSEDIDLRRITSPIKDPIHDYIPITELEARIIDTREFQRLRFILQNSAAYLTYPSNHSTRFAHSLGVMHISGNLFLKALENTDTDTLEALLEKANGIITSNGGSGIERFEKKLEHWKGKPCFTHSPSSGVACRIGFGFDEQKLRHSDYFIICCLWQAVRVGALVHDLGHLPMSHVFEDAIKLDKSKRNRDVVSILSAQIEEQLELYKKGFDEGAKEQIDNLKEISSSPKFHELRGLFLFRKMQPFIIKEDADIFFEKIISLSEKILISSSEDVCGSNEKEPFKFLGFLHSFFANSFVDVDRLDYTMRDPYSSGVKLADIDLDTIYATSFVRKEERGDCFFLTHKSNGLAAIEVFFHQRYLLYRNIVYHHNVIRMNAVLKKIIGLLLYLAESNTHPELSAIVMREGLYVKSAEYRFLPDGHGPEYDDAWLRTLLIACKHELKKNVKDVDLSQEDSDSDQRLLIYLELLLDTFLYRKSENIYSLWKRESDYYCWVLDAVEDLWKEAPNLPLLSEDQQKKLIEDIIIASSEDPAVESQFQVFFDHLRKTLSKDSIWVLSESISPKLYKPESHGNHVMANDKILDSSTASPYLSSFDRVSSLTPRRYLFFVCSGIKIPDKDQHGKEIGYINGQKCLNTAKLAFKDYISRVISMLPDLSSDIREPLLELQDGV